MVRFLEEGTKNADLWVDERSVEVDVESTCRVYIVQVYTVREVGV